MSVCDGEGEGGRQGVGRYPRQCRPFFHLIQVHLDLFWVRDVFWYVLVYTDAVRSLGGSPRFDTEPGGFGLTPVLSRSLDEAV